MSHDSQRPRKKPINEPADLLDIPTPLESADDTNLANDDDTAVVRPSKSIERLTQVRLKLNLAHAEVQRDLTDCQSMHRRVMLLFQHVNAPRDVNDILYRIDYEQQPQEEIKRWVTIQSTAYADVTMLPAGYAVPPIRTRDDVWERLQQTTVGRQYPFTLVANIVKRDFHLHRTRTVYDKEEQLTWLRRKGEQHGFRIDEEPNALVALEILRDPQVNGVHRNGRLSYDAFRISGMLTVVDPPLLAYTIATGIGKAKAYGFGLLTLVGV
jgi:CRISPR system Cascade subunit CasE